MTYITLATKQTPPPPTVRSEQQDWQALTPDEQRYIAFYMRYELPLEEATLRVQTFLRRHYPEGV